jgi:hypothetical protein
MAITNTFNNTSYFDDTNTQSYFLTIPHLSHISDMIATTIDERARTALASTEDPTAFTQPTIPASLHLVVVGASVVGGNVVVTVVVVGAAVVVIFTVVGIGATVVLLAAAVVTLASSPTTPKTSA